MSIELPNIKKWFFDMLLQKFSCMFTDLNQINQTLRNNNTCQNYTYDYPK